MDESFDLSRFLPYMLDRAAEASSREFEARYRARYGMRRTEWRVLFHLGLYGPLTAVAICRRAGIHKTKVSRAVAALEAKRFLLREVDASDRRSEILSLSRRGRAVYDDLRGEAERFDARLAEALGPDESEALRQSLSRIAGLG